MIQSTFVKDSIAFKLTYFCLLNHINNDFYNNDFNEASLPSYRRAISDCEVRHYKSLVIALQRERIYKPSQRVGIAWTLCR